MKAGLRVRHVDEGKNVPMYRTSIACAESGVFKGNMVVSMRPYRPEEIPHAIEITRRFPNVHGAPVYSGINPKDDIGIADINKPEYGEAVTINEGEVPVFWACGVTPQNVILSATEIPIVITHSPGCMLVTDLKNDQL